MRTRTVRAVARWLLPHRRRSPAADLNAAERRLPTGITRRPRGGCRSEQCTPAEKMPWNRISTGVERKAYSPFPVAARSDSRREAVQARDPRAVHPSRRSFASIHGPGRADVLPHLEDAQMGIDRWDPLL